MSTTIDGTNDKPVISSSTVTAASVHEDVNSDASGHIDATDVDKGDTLTYSVDSQGKYGNLTVDNQGKWHYTLDNSNKSVDALNDKDTLSDKATVKIDDGHGGVVTKEIDIAIDGHTDAPQVQMVQQVFTSNTHTASTFSQGQSTGLYQRGGDIVQPIKLHSTAKSGEHVTWHLVGGTPVKYSYNGEQVIQLHNQNGRVIGSYHVFNNGHSYVEVAAQHVSSHTSSRFSWFGSSSQSNAHTSNAAEFRPNHTGTVSVNVEVVDSKGHHSAPVPVNIVVDHTGIHSISIGGTAISDAPLEDLDQTNIDLLDTEHRIVLAQEELHTLQTKGEDTHELQTHLNDLEAQKVELAEHIKEVSGQDLSLSKESDKVDDATIDMKDNDKQEHVAATEHEENSVVPGHDAQMPSLDNVAEHLEAQKTGDVKIPEGHQEALATAATLLGDTQEDSKDAHIIKAVENQESKEHVAKPDAPVHDKADASSDNAEDSDASSTHGDYVADMHHADMGDIDNDDGTGLTS